MVINAQDRVAVDISAARIYVRKLRGALGLGRRDFNICFVTDRQIQQLSGAFLGRRRPTDVLAFPWGEPVRRPARVHARPHGSFPKGAGRNGRKNEGPAEFRDFLGDVVISAETARRNAREEGHSIQNEIRWLILHGLLHLLGFDHETDRGEMTDLELSLRGRLAGLRPKARRRKKLGQGALYG